MAEAGCYYRSTHPKAQEYWDELQSRWTDYRTQVEELESEFPGSRAVYVKLINGGRVVQGLYSQSQPGKEWREEQKGWWYPNQRYKAGKELAKRLSSIRLVYPSVPGMVEEVNIPQPDGWQTRIYWPSFELLSGVFWVRWTPTREQVEAEGTVDPEIWQPAKASEYWLAKEAEERREALEVTTTTE